MPPQSNAHPPTDRSAAAGVPVEPKQKVEGAKGEQKVEAKGASSEPKVAGPTMDQPRKDPEKQYECGWSEEHMCAWRKEIKKGSQRGPIEYSEVDGGVDENSSIVCIFLDGYTTEIAHITMATWKSNLRGLVFGCSAGFPVADIC